MDDPLTLALLPPLSESPSQRTQRLKAEAQAKRVSEEIDKQIKQDAQRRKKEKASEYRILLLGQAAAGKTTILKQMRMLYDPKAHETERKSWKEVVHLNLVTAVRTLLENMEAEAERPHPNKVLLEKLHFAPILSLETTLRQRLGAIGEDLELCSKQASSPSLWTTRSDLGTPGGRFDSVLLLRSGWQDRLLDRLRSIKDEDPQTLLSTFKDDVQTLWTEAKHLRKKAKLDATDSTAYFLDAYHRIAQPNYLATDEDILHARVRTLGITEDVFKIDKATIYRIYDVGGSRSQRPRWAPYFSDAQAIIFLAPISAFDQVLLEDLGVNRVKDSLALWEEVLANPLLSEVSLVLFLNKIDVLARKLHMGVRVKDFFRDFDGEEELEDVWRWFRMRFRELVRGEGSVNPKRPVYVHTTVATSTKQIKSILLSVNDTILRENLRVTGLAL